MRLIVIFEFYLRSGSINGGCNGLISITCHVIK